MTHFDFRHSQKQKNAPLIFLYVVQYMTKWYQTEIVPKKVYAAIWPILEISSLKFLLKVQLSVPQTLSHLGQIYVKLDAE